MYLVDHELEPRILEDIESGAELYLSKRSKEDYNQDIS